MQTMPAIDLAELLKDVPRGAWVAITRDESQIIAFGSDLRLVIAEAQAKGEPHPIVTRAPESPSTVML